MLRHLVVSAALAAFSLQSQAPPTAPPASPFAAAKIRRPGEGAPVALTFAWPAGMSATIEAEKTKTTLTPDGRKTERGALRYRMRVSAHKQGRLIEYDNFEPIGVSLSSAEQSSLDRLLNSLMPSLIVSDTGAFVRLGDLTKIRATMKLILDEMKKQAPGGVIPPNLQAMLDSVTSEKVLTQMAEAEWYSLVGAYLGYSGTIGTMKEFASREPLPIMPDVMVPMRTTFGAKQRGPCLARAADEDCVVMQMTSIVDDSAMQAVLKKILEGARGLEGVRYDDFDVTTEVLSTVDPATLLPHHVKRTKSAEFVMSAPGMSRVRASMVETRTYRITYHAAAAPVAAVK
jgi:hypothetical protein